MSARRGATAVEFALLFPVLFALVSGVATYSWLFLMEATLVDAVTEGARRSASYVAAPDDEDAGAGLDDGSSPFGWRIRETAQATTLAACERAGWDPEHVRVTTSFGERGGLNTLKIVAIADVDSRFDGWLFPLPETIRADIEVATLDQP